MGSRTLTKNLIAIEIKYFLTGKNMGSGGREMGRGNNAGFLKSVLLVKPWSKPESKPLSRQAPKTNKSLTKRKKEVSEARKLEYKEW